MSRESFHSLTKEKKDKQEYIACDLQACTCSKDTSYSWVKVFHTCYRF